MRLIHTQSNFSARAEMRKAATYILLANFTDQVIRKVKDSPGGRFQRDDEKVRSNREGRILDTRKV